MKEANSTTKDLEFVSKPDYNEADVIKAGEACLAASFTVLRPSIDGVDAILRSSTAAVANALSTKEMIILESTMACYR